MHALLISFVTFFFTFSASRIGPLIHAKLPSSDTAKEIAGRRSARHGPRRDDDGAVVGLVTAAAKGSFDTQDAAIKTSAANILTLDRHLAHFGAEAQPIRDLLAASARVPDCDDVAFGPNVASEPRRSPERLRGRRSSEPDSRAACRNRGDSVGT
jgi:hypothetical protein